MEPFTESVLKLMPIEVTITVQVAVCPSLSVAVIVAVPELIAVTTPSATKAMVGSELVQITVLFVVSEGETVAVKVVVSVSKI